MESMFVFELTVLGGFLLASLGAAGVTLYTGKKLKYGVVYGLIGLVTLPLFVLFFAGNPETWKLILVLLVALVGVAVVAPVAIMIYLKFVLK